MRAAATAVLAATLCALLAAGCGTVPAPGHGQPGAASSAPAGSGPASPSASPAPSSPAPATVAGNKALARREAAFLLSLAGVPPGAAAQAPPEEQPPPPGFVPPVSLTRAWRLHEPMSAVAAWVRAHPPAGLTAGGQGSGFGPGYQDASFSYAAAPGPAWADAELHMDIKSAGPVGSVLTAQASVTWLDPVPVTDSFSGPRVHVTVAGGCPRTDTSGVTSAGEDLRTRLVPAGAPTSGLECSYGGQNSHHDQQLIASARLSAAQAATVAANLAQLPVARVPGAATSCPMDDGSADIVALSYPGRPDVDLGVHLTGCSSVANGLIEVSGAGLPGAGPACLSGGLAACLKP